jgi:2-hydroxychromene-2-carboxylate isomerase
LVIQNLAESVGLNGKDLVNLANSQEMKARLRNQTEEAISLGVFGVPTVQVGKELFWGSEIDTLLHIEDALKGVDNYDRSLIEKWVSVKPSAARIKK